MYNRSNPSDGGAAASATAAAPADDDDLDDIFASLEQTEKELKKEAKRKAKKAAALPDGVVAAKKPKMGEPVAVKPAAAAPAAKPFVPPQMQNLLIPHSTQVRRHEQFYIFTVRQGDSKCEKNLSNISRVRQEWPQ